MVIGFAAALALPLALGTALGAAAGPHATATPTAASDCRNRLREMIKSRSIADLPHVNQRVTIDPSCRAQLLPRTAMPSISTRKSGSARLCTTTNVLAGGG